MAESREALRYNAKLAEQAERFEEMAEWMVQCVGAALAALTAPERQLTAEERNLLSVAFKNAVGAKRASWRVLVALEAKEKANLSDATENLAICYRKQVEAEISTLCHNLIKLVEDRLLPTAVTAEAKIAFLKMKADYHRYLAEVLTSPECERVSQAAQVAYADAAALAQASMDAADPARLSLALNRSVFYFEIRKNVKEATALARAALEAADERRSAFSDASKESNTILKLLRDNLTFWNSLPTS